MEKSFRKIIHFIRELYKQPEGFIPLHAPVFDGNEKKYLEECINSTFVSSVGKFVDQFEIKLAEYTGAKKAVVCVNGTNALHLALMLVGVERDTEVITQPLTFIATANAISYCGAHPVFIDVDMDTLGLSPIALRTWLEENAERQTPALSTVEAPNAEQALRGANTINQPQPLNPSTPQPLNSSTINKTTGRRISACVPMHTFGHPCRIDEIIEICNEYNIPVVEDAAESLGSFYKDQHTGTFGEIGVLSFNGNKVITTGGGGMLLFQDEELAKKAKHLTTQAKVSHPWEFIHDEIGYNYRMPNVNAALGLAQLEQLPGFLENKRQTAEKYKSFFSMTPWKFFSEPEHAISNYWLNVVLMDSRQERDEFLKYSNGNGVMTRPAWQLMNRMPMFKNTQTGNLKNAEYIAERLINIPSSINLR